MDIQTKHTAGFFVASFVVLALLGLLAAIAIPNVDRLNAHNDAEARTLELYQVESAVKDMLCASPCGELEPVGPTADVSMVHTRDAKPLVLTDYLNGVTLNAGCTYSFTADGTVLQYAP